MNTLQNIHDIIFSNATLKQWFEEWLTETYEEDVEPYMYTDLDYLDQFLDEEEMGFIYVHNLDAIEVVGENYYAPLDDTNFVVSTFFDHLPHVFYHGTSDIFKDKILKDGLFPAPQKKAWRDSSDYVFLTTGGANLYAKRAERVFGGNAMVLTIVRPLGGLVADPDDTDLSVGWEQWITSHVPPQFIVEVDLV